MFSRYLYPFINILTILLIPRLLLEWNSYRAYIDVIVFAIVVVVLAVVVVVVVVVAVVVVDVPVVNIITVHVILL